MPVVLRVLNCGHGFVLNSFPLSSSCARDRADLGSIPTPRPVAVARSHLKGGRHPPSVRVRTSSRHRQLHRARSPATEAALVTVLSADRIILAAAVGGEAMAPMDGGGGRRPLWLPEKDIAGRERPRPGEGGRLQLDSTSTAKGPSFSRLAPLGM